MQIRLLGDFDIRSSTGRIDGWESMRLRSILTYLIVHRRAPQPRQRVAFDLWPDSTESQARTNLRKLLHQLRGALPDTDLFVAGGTQDLQWRPDAPATVDLIAFEEVARPAEGLDRAALEEAASLYRGELLPGCYDEWLLPERERLQQNGLRILERLTEVLEDAGDLTEAVRYAEELLRLDRLHEMSYQRLMRLHTAQGERTRALRVYHTCVSTLERDLGVAPDPETDRIYEHLITAASQPRTGPPSPGAAVPAGSALIGRRHEFDHLVACWHAAQENARVAIVSGDAGVGKTRLVEELRSWCDHHHAATAVTRGYAAEGRLAYGPIVELLRSDAVRPIVSGLDEIWMTEIARLLPELLREYPALPAPRPLADPDLRRPLFEALTRAIIGGVRPLLLVIDDLQWCDAETLDFLHFLARRDREGALMVAATVRRGEVSSERRLQDLLGGLRAIDALVDVSLEPLDAEESRMLADALSRTEVDDQTAERLFRESEGYPLFLVEMIRAGTGDAGSDTGEGPLPAVELPPKVRGVIESRLAQLSDTAREVVRIAAAIGREFTSDIVQRVSGFSQDDLVAALDELWHRRLVREQGLEAYDFSHDKIREVAYASTGPARRRRIHLHIARALEDRHAQGLDAVAGQIAAHYERAGSLRRAVFSYRRAVEAALRLLAHDEVIELARRALRLIRQLPEGPERDEDELGLLIPLGAALMAGRGVSVQDLPTYERARELRRRHDKPVDESTLRVSANLAISHRDFEEAAVIGAELLERGRREDNRVVIVEGHYLLGVSSFWLGDLPASREHLEHALALYDAEDAHEHLERFAQEPRAVCLVRLGYTEWHVGKPERAQGLCDQSIARARSLDHPYTLGYALAFSALLAIEFGDVAQVDGLSREIASIGRGNAWLVTTSEMLDGWLRIERGQHATGIRRIQEAIEGMRSSGQLLFEVPAQILLGHASAIADDPVAGLRALDEARVTCDRSMPCYRAEVHRLRGELLAAIGGGDREIDAELHRAVVIAEDQGALMIELRARVSLLRWLRSSGAAGAPDAHAGLQETYQRFTEGLDTPDLLEAKALLTPP